MSSKSRARSADDKLTVHGNVRPQAIAFEPSAGVRPKSGRQPPPYPPGGRAHFEVQAWHNLRQQVYPDQIASALAGTRLVMAQSLVRAETVTITATRTHLGFKATVQDA